MFWILNLLLALTLIPSQLAAIRTTQLFAPQKDSPCSDAPTVAREACLGKASPCMWLELDGKNLCLPCQWGGIDIPCAASGSFYPQGKVRRCEMTCGHQKVITKISACTDVSGFITKEACFKRGDAAQVKCAWTSYKTGGMSRTMCGPCMVPGIGKVPPLAPGNMGPVAESTVEASASQCDPPPDQSGEPNATAAAEELRPASLESAGLRAREGSPRYVVVRVRQPRGPEEYWEASEVAAAAAGWPPGAERPPEAGFAVLGDDPEDNRLPLIRAIANSDTKNMSKRYVLPPPGILDMPAAVRVGLDNVTVNNVMWNNTAAFGDHQDRSTWDIIYGAVEDAVGAVANTSSRALALLAPRAVVREQQRRLRPPGP